MKSKFEKAQPRANIIDVFSRLLGRPVNVKFLTEDEASVVITGALPAQAATDVKKNSETDALVKMMTEELGGRIVGQ